MVNLQNSKKKTLLKLNHWLGLKYSYLSDWWWLRGATALEEWIHFWKQPTNPIHQNACQPNHYFCFWSSETIFASCILLTDRDCHGGPLWFIRITLKTPKFPHTVTLHPCNQGSKDLASFGDKCLLPLMPIENTLSLIRLLEESPSTTGLYRIYVLGPLTIFVGWCFSITQFSSHWPLMFFKIGSCSAEIW